MACVGTLSNCLAPVRLIPNAFWSFSLSLSLLLHKLPRSLTRAAHFWLRQHAFDTPIANAADLFAGDHRREGVEQQDFLHVFGALASERPCSPPSARLSAFLILSPSHRRPTLLANLLSPTVAHACRCLWVRCHRVPRVRAAAPWLQYRLRGRQPRALGLLREHPEPGLPD